MNRWNRDWLYSPRRKALGTSDRKRLDSDRFLDNVLDEEDQDRAREEVAARRLRDLGRGIAPETGIFFYISAVEQEIRRRGRGVSLDWWPLEGENAA